MPYEYDDPNFLIIRERQFSAAISTAAVGSAYIGCSLKVYTKALILGCVARSGSVSAAATNSLSIARIGTAGTISNMQTFTFASVAAGTELVMSLTAGFTVNSIGEAAGLTGSAASFDKVAVLADVIWQYRLLPYSLPIIANQG